MYQIEGLEDLALECSTQIDSDSPLHGWLLHREEEGYILESPLIPVEPAEQLAILRGCLLDNFFQTLPLGARYIADEDGGIRIQALIDINQFAESADLLEQAYRMAVDGNQAEESGATGTVASTTLEEPEVEELAREGLALTMLRKLFDCLAQDRQLKDHLYLDELESMGTIESFSAGLNFSVFANTQEQQLEFFLVLEPLFIGADEDYVLSKGLWANSLLRLDPHLMICCQMDMSTLFLRGSLHVNDVEIAKVKPLLGRMLVAATRFRKMLDEGDYSGNPKQQGIAV